ncbi:hypothetical protein [Nocardioides korecus]
MTYEEAAERRYRDAIGRAREAVARREAAIPRSKDFKHVTAKVPDILIAEQDDGLTLQGVRDFLRAYDGEGFKVTGYGDELEISFGDA